jgi:hypothetical protein
MAGELKVEERKTGRGKRVGADTIQLSVRIVIGLSLTAWARTA